MARALSASEDTPKELKACLDKACTAWLSNTEVLALIQGCHKHGLPLCDQPPNKPDGGRIFLYDRKQVRSFRKDGHSWRKKHDNRTIRETHEKLKVGSRDALNCYYAHPDEDGYPQRRCYWLLNNKHQQDIVLVHYLVPVPKNKVSSDGSRRGVSSSPELSSGSGSAQDPPHVGAAAGDDDSVDVGPVEGFGGRGLPTPPMEDMDMDLQLDLDLDFDVADIPRLTSADNSDAFIAEINRMRDNGGGPSELQERREGMELGEQPAALDIGSPRGLIMHEEPVMLAGLGAPWLVQGGQGDFGGGMGHRGPRGNFVDDGIPQAMTWMQERGLHAERQRSAQLPQEIGSPYQASQGFSTSAPFQRSNAIPGRGSNTAFFGHPYSIDGPSPQSAPREAAAFSAPRQQEFSWRPAEAGGWGAADTGRNGMPAPASRRAAPSPFASPFNSQGPYGELEASDPFLAAATPGPGFGSANHMPRMSSGALPLAHRGRHLGSRSISMDLGRVAPPAGHPRMPELRWEEQLHAVELEGREGDDMGGSKARLARRSSSRVAFDLEANLTRLSASVTNLIRQNNGQGLEHQEDQLRMFERELDNLGNAAARMNRSKSAASPLQDNELFTERLDFPEAREDTISSSAALTWADNSPQQTGVESHRLSFTLHDDYAPEWDFTCGGQKLILTCKLNETGSTNLPDSQLLHVSFGGVEVPTSVIRVDGSGFATVKTVVPPHDAGEVDLHLTLGDGRPLSNPKPFHYRMCSSSEPGPAGRVLVGEPDQALQRHMIALLQGQSHSGPSEHSSGSGRSTGTSQQQQQAAHPGHRGRLADAASPRQLASAGDSLGQGERLLQELIEKRIRQHLHEGSWAESYPPGSLARRHRPLCALNESGVAGIHLLAGLGYSRALEGLLACGADASTKDAHGFTPLHWAAARGRLDAVALLTAREADVEALTFQREGRLPGGQAPADAAAMGGQMGLAAFLGEVQLQRAHQRLRDAGDVDQDDGHAQIMQRKRSRHLPAPMNANSPHSPLPSPTSGQAYNAVAWPGKENFDGVAAIICEAKQHAQQLENALLRKHARKFARQEKKERALKREREALARIQKRREEWQLLSEQLPTDRRDATMARCLGIGKAIVDIQQTLEVVMKTRPSSAGGSSDVPEAGDYLQVKSDGYGSDSDLTMSRRGSLLGQRKAQHLHDYRGSLGSGSSAQKSTDTDLRKLLSSGGPLAESPDLESRSQSKSVISRALAHVEQLEIRHPITVAQYAAVKQAAHVWRATKKEVHQGFKFARFELPSC